jgi:exonuclease SbcC
LEGVRVKIVHISDLHIRLNTRIDEYRSVFNKLYKSVREQNPDLIVLTGDMNHQKSSISPNSLSLLAEFLKELSDIQIVWVIAGNHDQAKSTYESMDSIEPIVSLLNKQTLKHKIIYYKVSGKYELNENHSIILYDFRDIENWKTYSKKENEIFVGLYHGQINGWKDGSGNSYEGETGIEVFEQCDIVLLGDIHMQQSWRDNEIKYAGSLICQNFGEENYPHGYLIWDTETKTNEFIPVDNNWGYLTLTDKDFKIIDDNTCKLIKEVTFSEYQLRCKLENHYTNEQILSIKKDIKSKLHKDITIQQYIDTPQSIKEFSKLDLSNIKVQNSLIEEYCDLNKMSNVEEILKINEELNKEIRIKDILYNVRWQPLYLEWSNMFNFGDSASNKIDFTKLESIVAIIGKNGYGKSSISAILLFALYSKAPGIDKIEEVINNRKNDAHVQVIVRIENDVYRITKDLIRKKKTVSTSVSFEKYNKLNSKFEVDLEKVGDDKKDIKRNIETILGNYDDIVSQTFTVKGDEDSPLKKTETVLRDYVNKFLGLNIFELLYKAGAKRESEAEAIIKQYKDISFEDKIETLELQSSENINNIDILVNTISEKDKKISEIDDSLNSEKIKLESIIDKKSKISELNLVKTKIIEIKSDISTIDLLISKLKINYNLETDKLTKLKIIDIAQEISKLESEKNVIQINISSLSDEKKDIVANRENLNKQLIKNKEVKVKIDALNIKIKELSTNITNYKRQTEILDKQAWMTNFDNCKICELAKDAFVAKEKLTLNENTVTKASELLGKYNSIYNDKIDIDLKNINDSISKVNTKLLTLESDNSKLSDKMSNIKKIESDIILLEKNIIGIQDNITLNIEKKNLLYKSLKDTTDKLTELEKYDKDIKLIGEIEGNIKTFNQYKSDVKSEIIKLRKQLDECNSKTGYIISQIENVKEEENKYNIALNKSMAIKAYREIVSRNGLPITVLNKFIPIINEKIKYYLDELMLDFSIYFKIEDSKLKIIINKYNAECGIKLASGKETILSSWVIRATLSEISILPSTNMFLLDEGFGSFDLESLSNINILFDKLKQKFEKIILISHLPIVLDIAESFLEVAPDEQGFSQILKN